MSFTGAEKYNDTGCWQAAAHRSARSFRAVCLTGFSSVSSDILASYHYVMSNIRVSHRSVETRMSE